MIKDNINKILLIIIILFVIVNCNNKLINKKFFIAKNGVIDLTFCDIENDGVVKLDGEWEFYWEKLLTPDDFNKDIKPLYTGYVLVPKPWSNFKINNRKIPFFGYGTYRLKILLNKTNSTLALRITNIFSSYKLWIDNKLYIKSGIPGKTRNATKPKDIPRIVFFNVDKEEFYITIQAANFHDNPGGICFPIIFGEAHTVQNEKMKRENFDIFLFGSILIVSFFHFGLFILRKKDKSLLFFTIFCFVIAVRGIFTGEHVLLNYFSFLNYELQKKVEFFTLSFGVISFIMFLFTQYPSEVSKYILAFFIISSFLYSLLIIFTPLRVYCNFLMYFQFVIILACIYTIFVLVVAAFKKREGAVLFVLGFFILFISIVIEILQDRLKIKVGYYIPFGMLIFIITQAFILAKKFSMAFTKVENYSLELEEKVKERTLQLEKVNEEKTDLFINIAHETKTPLTLINNYLGAYINKHGLTNELKIIKKNFERLLKNMIDYFDLEKIIKGKIIYEHNDIVNFSDFLINKIIIFSEFAKTKNIKIYSNIASNLFIKINENAIDRIINNLIENAIKFTNDNGEVYIDLYEKNNFIYFSVEDTGIGLTDEEIAHICEPYYQTISNKKNVEGLGMGLNIVKKIVDSINGEILIESKINEGTAFIIKFLKYYPVDKVKIKENININIDDNSKVHKIFENVEYKKGRYNIFIVEDNLDLLSFLVDNMKSYFNIFYAINGKDALKKIEKIPKINLIISDIMMNEMDGYEFYDNLIMNKKYKRIPFIFLTARTFSKEKIDALKKGAIDFIYKPFLIEELIAKINSILKIQDALKKENLLKISNKLYSILDMTEDIKIKKNIKGASESKRVESYYKYGISKRETQIISLLRLGLEHKEIADRLNISIYTVRTYIRRIYEKCNVNNKVGLLNLFK